MTDINPHDEISNWHWFWTLTLRAFVSTIVVYFTVVYLHQGSLIFNADGSTIFNKMMVFELSASFVFFLFVFLAHRGISSLLNNSRLNGLHSLIKGTIEASLVVISSILLLFLLFVIPFFLTFPEVEVPPGRIRFNNIFMAIITLFFYYFVERERSNKQLQAEIIRSTRLQKENFEAELQHLKNQVSPHFLFNSLNVLSSLIQKDQEKAVIFVQKLSDVYRSFLDNSTKELIALKSELKVVNAYNYLLKTRFGAALEFKVHIPDENKGYLPPGSLQTLVENAIKHNGSTRKDPLVIKIFTEGGHVVVSNKLRPRQTERFSTKTGLQNITNRYKYLSNKSPEFKKVNNEFIAKLPLLQPKSIEGVNH